MSGINNIQAEGQIYDILAPEIVNDYVEKLGKTCINPNGYTKGSLILATDGSNVQRLYKTTSNISSNQVISEGGNVELKKLEDLFDDLETELSGDITDLDTELGNVKNALSNEAEARATLGAHNLLKNQNYTHVVSGVTFTLNNDGSWTLNGTASGEIYFPLFETTDSSQYPLKQGTRYKISGCPSGGSLSSSYRLLVTMGSSNVASDIGSGAEFTAPAWDTGYHVYINVVKNQVLNNLTFYPMIRLASDPSSKFTPYAMTNQQLTDELSVEDASANVTSVDDAFSNIAILKTGKVVQITATLAAGTTAGVKQFKITKYAPKMISTCNGVALSDAADAGKVISAQVLDSGWAYISLSSTLTDAVKVGFVYITA